MRLNDSTAAAILIATENYLQLMQGSFLGVLHNLHDDAYGMHYKQSTTYCDGGTCVSVPLLLLHDSMPGFAERPFQTGNTIIREVRAGSYVGR
jgi:hypothetical protein